MHASCLGHIFILVFLTFDKVTLNFFRALSEMLPFCLFLQLGIFRKV